MNIPKIRRAFGGENEQIKGFDLGPAVDEQRYSEGRSKVGYRSDSDRQNDAGLDRR
jgi:hypothetical protein